MQLLRMTLKEYLLIRKDIYLLVVQFQVGYKTVCTT